MIDDPSFRANAALARDEALAAPSLASVAAELETLTSAHRTG
ncbi:hypothetical protein [Thermocatellispora tengchongensis]